NLYAAKSGSPFRAAAFLGICRGFFRLRGTDIREAIFRDRAPFAVVCPPLAQGQPMIFIAGFVVASDEYIIFPEADGAYVRYRLFWRERQGDKPAAGTRVFSFRPDRREFLSGRLRRHFRQEKAFFIHIFYLSAAVT